MSLYVYDAAVSLLPDDRYHAPHHSKSPKAFGKASKPPDNQTQFSRDLELPEHPSQHPDSCPHDPAMCHSVYLVWSGCGHLAVPAYREKCDAHYDYVAAGRARSRDPCAAGIQGPDETRPVGYPPHETLCPPCRCHRERRRYNSNRR